jgi:hypothetical protein
MRVLTQGGHLPNMPIFRICACLYYWLKHHPNDLIHRPTRQRIVTFLRERVAPLPSLNEIYLKLLPLSYNCWQWPYQQPHSPGDCIAVSRSASVSGSILTTTSSSSDTVFDSGFHNVPSTPSEQDMDEDREWGLYDQDEVLPEAKKSQSMEDLALFPPIIRAPARSASTNGGRHSRTSSRTLFAHTTRDRRSSTGSLTHTSPCAMEAFVASRRGSVSSVSSGTTHSNPLNPAYVPSAGLAEGDLTPQQQLQPMISMPFTGKRSGSQSHRQKQAQAQSQQLPMQGALLGGPQGGVYAAWNASMTFKETLEEAPVHPLALPPQSGRASPLPPSVDYLSMNTSFIDIKDAALAAQLTCVEFGLFKKLTVRRTIQSRVRCLGVHRARNTDMETSGEINSLETCCVRSGRRARDHHPSRNALLTSTLSRLGLGP